MSQPPPNNNAAARPMLGEREFARRSSGGLVLRAAPLRIGWEISELTTGDGHQLRCVFSCAVQPNARAADQRMLEETLLTVRDVASADDVACHFEPALRSAAARVSAANRAEQLLADDGDGKREMLDALRTAANTIGFASGTDVLPPFHVELHSPTRDRERMDSMQRRLAERRAAGQVEHLQRTTELFRQFQSLRDAAPALSPGRLLERIGASDRGTMLEALLLASDEGGDPPPLWAVAGPTLVRIDSVGSSAQPRIEMIELPATLGPLRSVRCATVDGERVLLIGARSGVMLVNPNDPSGTRIYAAPEDGSALGFNSVVTWDGKLWATHRDAGLAVWTIDQPGPPIEMFRDIGDDATTSPGFAHLCGLGDRIVYSQGATLRGRTRGGGEAEPVALGSEPIVGIVPSGDGCIVVCASGEVIALTSEDNEGAAHLAHRRCGRVRAAALLPWLGDARLLLATDDGPVCCVGIDDSLVTQYVSTHRGLKALAATGGLVAGVTGDRQRLVLWHSWDGTKPLAELQLGSLTKHRVADACFA